MTQTCCMYAESLPIAGEMSLEITLIASCFIIFLQTAAV